MLIILGYACSVGTINLVPKESYNLKLREPSGIVYDQVAEHFIIVSDEGGLASFDFDFNKLESYKIKKGDLEGVTIRENELILLNEAKDQVIVALLLADEIDIKNRYKLTKTGSNNTGYEGITYDDDQEFFVTVSQSYPSNILIFDESFNEIEKITFETSKMLSDIFYYRGFYYLLSDDDKSIYKVNQDFELSATYLIPVIDAEGICVFDKKLYVVSDGEAKLYIFDLPR